MKKIPKIIFTLVLFFFLSNIALAQNEKWVFLPASIVFTPLSADPREPNSSLEISPDTTRYDLSLGGTLDLLQLKFSNENLLGFGILGASYLKIIRYAWASFRLEDSDLWYGLYLSQSSGQFSNRIEYRHGSSHLGDWLFGPSGTQFSAYGQTFTYQQAISYERDLIQFADSYHPFDFLRLYGGLGYWLYATPNTQPFYLHLGIEIYTNYSKIIGIFVRGFCAYDFKAGDQIRGVLDQNYQMGIQTKPSTENSPTFNLTINYYNGNSEYGQFCLQNDNHFGLEVSFLP